MLIKRICENPNCKKEFYEQECRVKEGKGRFCCRECYDLSRKTNQYIFFEDYIVIKIKNSKGEFFDCYIDKEDYDKVKDYTWGIENKKDRGTYYIASKTFKKRVSMHRLLMNCNDVNLQIDHINHLGYDNRKKNLRIVTNKENHQNMPVYKNNTTGVNGISFKNGKWSAKIKNNYKFIKIGEFNTKEEAIKARKQAEIELGWINTK